MLLAHKLAGFTLEESNDLRKLLVKPETSLADKVKRERIEIGERFIKGCVSKGVPEPRARRLWEKEILGFISYGFCKCLHPDTKVDTKAGSKKLSQVVPGDFVNSRNGYVRVIQKHSTGKKKLFKIKTQTGKELICTLDHKLETKEGMKTLRDVIDNKLEILCK